MSFRAMMESREVMADTLDNENAETTDDLVIYNLLLESQQRSLAWCKGATSKLQLLLRLLSSMSLDPAYIWLLAI